MQIMNRSRNSFLCLLGAGLILSSCSSNDSTGISSKESLRKDVVAEEGSARVRSSSKPTASQADHSVAGGATSSPDEQIEKPKVIEAVALEPSSPVTGDQLKATVTLDASVQSSPELLYRWKKNGQTVQESSSEVLGDVIKRGDMIEVEVMASHGTGESSNGVSNYTMVGNAPPAIRLAGQTIGNEGAYQAKVESSDPEGDNFDLSIKEGPPGLTIDNGGNIRWAMDAKTEGMFSVAVSARDIHGAETALSYQIRIHREPNGKAS